MTKGLGTQVAQSELWSCSTSFRGPGRKDSGRHCRSSNSMSIAGCWFGKQYLIYSVKTDNPTD